MTDQLEQGWRESVGTGEITDVDDGRHAVQVIFPHDVVDRHRTTFSADCFRSYLESHRPGMCWQHDITDLIGRAVRAQNLPKHNELIGEFSDFDDVPQARRAFSQIRDGHLTDFSYYFRNARSRAHPNMRGVRQFISAEMPEFSPVTAGSIPGAVVTNLRSEEDRPIMSIPTIAELLSLRDRQMLDDAGLRSLMGEHYPDMVANLRVPDAAVTPDAILEALADSRPDLAQSLRSFSIRLEPSGTGGTRTQEAPGTGGTGTGGSGGGGGGAGLGAPEGEQIDEFGPEINLLAIDDSLDAAVSLFEQVDVSEMPDEVQQGLALIGAAWAASGQLLDDIGVMADAERGAPADRSGRLAELGLVDPESLRAAAETAGFSTTPWSKFSESDYTPEQYRSAALIVHNGGKSKDDCKLPVKEPDGKININAVHAAAAALAGARSALQASPEEKATAAKALLGHYSKAGQKPPPSLLKLAGEGQRSEAYEPIAHDGTGDVRCVDCGLGNESDARFCDQCRAQLDGAYGITGKRAHPDQPHKADAYRAGSAASVLCPNSTCRLLNMRDARFCDQCGTRMVGRTDIGRAEGSDPQTGRKTTTDAGSTGSRSAEELDQLPDTDFALPESRDYPIDSEDGARSSLEYVTANGTDEEKDQVRAAVKSRYPSMIDVDEINEPADTGDDNGDVVDRGRAARSKLNKRLNAPRRIRPGDNAAQQPRPEVPSQQGAKPSRMTPTEGAVQRPAELGHH